VLTCPKCNGQMEEGFIVDERHRFYRKVSTWVQGRPERSFMTGVRLSGKRTFETKRMFETTAFRCTECGYLESYAIDRH
jgi:hypothetical protein